MLHQSGCKDLKTMLKVTTDLILESTIQVRYKIISVTSIIRQNILRIKLQYL